MEVQKANLVQSDTAKFERTKDTPFSDQKVAQTSTKKQLLSAFQSTLQVDLQYFQQV